MSDWHAAGEHEARATDRVVGQRLSLGDEAALAEVYDRFSAVVFTIALRVTANRSAAEDVTQEVFIQVWEQADRYDAVRGSLRSWVATLAHRRSVDWVRREMAHRRRESRTTDPVDMIGVDVEEEVVRLHVSERVRAAVQRLPAAQRMVVSMAYYEGHTLKEVAVALGVPEGTAKSRRRAALIRLNGWLAPEGMVSV